MKKDYDSTKIYRKTQKKGASQTYDTPSFIFGQIIEKINCEDRAILFTRIVRDLLGLKFILIYYPGHLASAVFRTLSAAPIPTKPSLHHLAGILAYP